MTSASFLSDGSVSLPLVEQLDPALDSVEVFRRLADKPYCIFFDSAMRDSQLGRYSYIAVDPYDFLQVAADQTDGLATLAGKMPRGVARRLDGIPPFQGGAAGLIGYELGRSLEVIPKTQFDEFQIPAVAIGFYDVVIAFDHLENQAWIISQGLPETDPKKRRRRAEKRFDQIKTWLNEPSHRATADSSNSSQIVKQAELSLDQLAPQFPTNKFAGLTSNFSPEGYLKVVQRAIDYIYAGDVFQVNISQRLLCRATSDPLSLYLRLRERNSATFASYFDAGSFQLCSASPERYLKVVDRQVEARPIKGTRARRTSPEADLYVGDELQASEKDRAENVMIVDLLRNDLSRVCLPDSVRTTELCRLETYAYVKHLVSVIQGELQPDCCPVKLLKASFPGGSITGAPKVRAMEIIAELEPTARGAYCGSLIWLGFDGTLDTSILIRTVTASKGWWQFPVGGGIVAQSNPERELEETWHKAEGILRALN